MQGTKRSRDSIDTAAKNGENKEGIRYDSEEEDVTHTAEDGENEERYDSEEDEEVRQRYVKLLTFRIMTKKSPLRSVDTSNPILQAAGLDRMVDKIDWDWNAPSVVANFLMSVKKSEWDSDVLVYVPIPGEHGLVITQENFNEVFELKNRGVYCRTVSLDQIKKARIESKYFEQAIIGGKEFYWKELQPVHLEYQAPMLAIKYILYFKSSGTKISRSLLWHFHLLMMKENVNWSLVLWENFKAMRKEVMKILMRLKVDQEFKVRPITYGPVILAIMEGLKFGDLFPDQWDELQRSKPRNLEMSV